MHRTWVTLLVLPALAFRLLIPAGFMPGVGAGFTITMQMCHGAGPLPTPAGHDPGQPQPRHDSPCVFAAAGMVAPPPMGNAEAGYAVRYPAPGKYVMQR